MFDQLTGALLKRSMQQPGQGAPMPGQGAPMGARPMPQSVDPGFFQSLMAKLRGAMPQQPQMPPQMPQGMGQGQMQPPVAKTGWGSLTGKKPMMPPQGQGPQSF